MAASQNTSANSVQVGGSHYKKMPLEHWDLVALAGLDYYQGNITKYVMRWRDKGGIEDLKKARHYLDKYIELEELRARCGDVGMQEHLIEDTLRKLSPVVVEAPPEDANAPTLGDLLRESLRCESRAYSTGQQCELERGHAGSHAGENMEWG